MKKITKKMLVLFALVCMVTVFMPAKAAKVPEPAKNIKLKEYTYYKYWEKNRDTLLKAGLYEGEGYDAEISWSPSSNATNYKVELSWEKENGKSYKTVVYAIKSGSLYRYTTKGHGKGANWIAKSVKSSIYNGYTKQFKSRSLKFNVTGNSEKIRLSKVSVTAYNVSHGKKTYAKKITLKNEPVVMVHDYYVKPIRKIVAVKSGGVNIRTQPWNGAGSQVVDAAGFKQRLRVTGQVYNRATGAVAQWYRINWNGVSRFVNTSYVVDVKPGPNPPTPDPKPVKKYMKVVGVKNYLGVRWKKTTDERYEVGRLYNGDKVRVINHSDKTYYYVQGINRSVRGFVLARYLK